MQLSATQLIFGASVFTLVFYSIRRLIQGIRERDGLPLPPGPAQIPLLGNIHSINIEEPWKTYTDWHAKYGDVVYLRLLDQDVVVLGSERVAVELLEKRSQIYSDRPFIASVLPFGGDCTFILAPYGDHWRFCRRILHQTFRPEAAVNFRPVQLHRARQLVINIADDPDRYQAHFSTFALAVGLSAAYGYEPSMQHDPIVQIIEEYSTAATLSVTPEKSILLKLFPFLLHIPDWCPGSSLKREADHAYGLSRKVVEMPYQYAEKQMKSSRECTTFSMVSDHLSRMQEQDNLQRTKYVSALKNAAVTSIIASGETTSSILMIFTLAMVLHPDVWKRAQAELDAIVGKNRLPDFEDRSSLPYVNAIVRECLRWHPVTPMGIWHATTKSDVYDGYYIPKGATVVGNAWAMSRDETRFPNPDNFSPERYLNEDGTLNDIDPASFTFGFGRRICPGRYTGDGSLWSAIATMLATLDFCLAKDAEERDLVFEPKWLNGITHFPAPFLCRLPLREHVNKEEILTN